MKDYRLGEVVQLTEAKSVWGLGTVPKGTKGVVVRRPGALSGGYEVRLDRTGRRVELPPGALDKTGGWWAGVVPAQVPRERKAAPRPQPAPGPEVAPKALASSTPPTAARVPWRARPAGVRDHSRALSPWAPARRPPTASAGQRGGPAPACDGPPGAAAAEGLARRLRTTSRALEWPHDQTPTDG